MRVLVIDNNIDLRYWGAADLRRYAFLYPGARFDVRRAPQRDLPKDPKVYDRVIISGSMTRILDDAPWIFELENFLKQVFCLKIPVLGVCYGHQLIVRILAGKDHVQKAKTPEFGWTKVNLLAPSVLFKGLPKHFYSFSSHYDEVRQLPKTLSRLAHSSDCQIQAFESKELPVFGIQFHPEKQLKDGLLSYREHLQNKIKHPFLGADQGEQLYDASVGEKIFKNFLLLK
jgi:GMP synthase-like glutamine amidotransferase